MLSRKNTLLAIIWGIIASCFLSSTFIINSLISGAGGYWAWTAALRSLFLIPVLATVLLFKGELRDTFKVICQYPMLFFKWGTIGFGLLYTLLAIASLFSPGWMVAASFQINILAGILLAPFIYTDHRKIIPKRTLILTLMIFAGVLLMQLDKLSHLNSFIYPLTGFLIVVVGAVFWPLGNRKIMVDLAHHQVKINAIQRVLGMTIGSLPLLIILCITGYLKSGMPDSALSLSSFYSALSSGFIGGVAFYHATQLVNHDSVSLAAVEATQALEIFFTLIGEMILKGLGFPGVYAQLGFGIILIGLLTQFYLALRTRAVNISLHRS